MNGLSKITYDGGNSWNIINSANSQEQEHSILIENEILLINLTSSLQEESSIKIYNIQGRPFLEQKISLSCGKNEIKIDIGELNNGLYFYKVFVNSTIHQNKFLVAR